jgi:hypothetical protein
MSEHDAAEQSHVDFSGLENHLRAAVTEANATNAAPADTPQEPPAAPAPYVPTLADVLRRIVAIHDQLVRVGQGAEKIANRVSATPAMYSMPADEIVPLDDAHPLVNGCHVVLDDITRIVYSLSDSMNRTDAAVG